MKWAACALLLQGCCHELFRSEEMTTKVYEVQDLVRHLKMTEAALADHIENTLLNEGYRRDLGEIKPQRGIIVVYASARAQARIAALLAEMTP
jgi:hypothetical protein